MTFLLWQIRSNMKKNNIEIIEQISFLFRSGDFNKLLLEIGQV